jgi:hypothetical protein
VAEDVRATIFCGVPTLFGSLLASENLLRREEHSLRFCTSGVARGSLVIVLDAANSFHQALEPVFLLFDIDQLMDMPRTAVNVLGNCLATVVIAKWEGETVK